MNEISPDNRKTGPDQNAAPERPAVVHAQRRKFLPGLLITLALASAISALYLVYTGRHAGQSTRATVENLVETSERLGARLGELETQIEQLQEAEEATTRSLFALTRELPGSNEDWALAEIEFLLVIAVHHAQLERNPGAALEAMQTAELRLRGLDNTALDPVREQLARDINRLQEVKSPDISGLALLLRDLADRAHSLPLAGEKDQPLPAASAAEEERASSVMGAIWREVKNLVIIKHEEGGRPASLLPGQEYFVYQNLRLELESARLSLLRRDTENLHASVVVLQKWLEEYFSADDPAVINVKTSLHQLSSINLEPPIPDISSSLESLRAYMREKAAVSRRDEESRTPQT